MNPALPTGLPFEVFHRVRNVNFLAINSRFFEGLIHDFSSGSNEGFTLLIFVIARLFADQHDRRVSRAFAKHGLCSPLVEMTRFAFARGVAHLGQA
jgi:hypothetical protein